MSSKDKILESHNKEKRDSTGKIMDDTCVMAIKAEPDEQNMSHDECIEG